jgi:hypothetical protein
MPGNRGHLRPMRLLPFAAAAALALALNCQWHDRIGMSDTGRTVPPMME